MTARPCTRADVLTGAPGRRARCSTCTAKARGAARGRSVAAEASRDERVLADSGSHALLEAPHELVIVRSHEALVDLLIDLRPHPSIGEISFGPNAEHPVRERATLERTGQLPLAARGDEER